jgi:hypothetical protein
MSFPEDDQNQPQPTVPQFPTDRVELSLPNVPQSPTDRIEKGESSDNFEKK